ncbi:hypothetical protein QCB52_00420, partial [Myroides odoratimimus]
LMDHTANIKYLTDIVDYVQQGQSTPAEYWVSEEYHLKVCPRNLRENAKEVIYDTSLDFYFKEGNYTIRFNIDEREEKVTKLLGLISKKIWAKEVYTYYYFYEEGEETSNDYEVYGGGKHPDLDKVAQQLWNTWVEKIKTVN